MNTTHITHLSPSTVVNMANAWFDVSPLSHSWIKRRFEVLRHIMVQVPMPKGRAAEIGCGNGLLQVQMEDLLGAPINCSCAAERRTRREHCFPPACSVLRMVWIIYVKVRPRPQARVVHVGARTEM